MATMEAPDLSSGDLATTAKISFAPAKNYKTDGASFAWRILAADFNSDGKPDLAVSNANTRNITLYLNRGDGSFNAGVNIPADVGPRTLLAADANGDSKLDIILLSGNYVTVLYGDGTGRFSNGPQVQLYQYMNPEAMALGDLNNDKIPDIVVSGSGKPSKVAVLLGQAGGGFGAPLFVPVGSYAERPSIADIYGKSDIVVPNSGDNNIQMLANAGMGTSFNAQPPQSVSHNPQAVAVADFDGNGHNDVAVSGDIVSVLYNSGTAFASKSLPAGGGAIKAANINGGARPDIIVATDHVVQVLVNDGNGGFLNPASFAAGNGNDDIAVADFDGDGKLDIATASDLDGIYVLLNNSP